MSAQVESARVLSTIQEKLTSALFLEKERTIGGEAFVTRDSFIADLRQIAREEGVDNIDSWGRAKLIFDTQQAQAYGYAYAKTFENPDSLDVYPASRLIRTESRDVPRGWRSTSKPQRESSTGLQ